MKLHEEIYHILKTASHNIRINEVLPEPHLLTQTAVDFLINYLISKEIKELKYNYLTLTFIDFKRACNYIENEEKYVSKVEELFKKFYIQEGVLFEKHNCQICYEIANVMSYADVITLWRIDLSPVNGVKTVLSEDNLYKISDNENLLTNLIIHLSIFINDKSYYFLINRLKIEKELEKLSKNKLSDYLLLWNYCKGINDSFNVFYFLWLLKHRLNFDIFKYIIPTKKLELFIHLLKNFITDLLTTFNEK